MNQSMGQRSNARTFASILGLGALAVAVVGVAVGFHTVATGIIQQSDRDLAALDLLEQRHTVSNLYSAETAALLADRVIGGNSLIAPPFTAQRVAAEERMKGVLSRLIERGDSVADEARRLRTAVDVLADPQQIEDPFERLVASANAATVACCAGLIDSDKHHTDTVRRLEDLTDAPAANWLYFYVAVQMMSNTDQGIPPDVDQFLEILAIPERLPLDTAPLDVQLETTIIPQFIAAGAPRERARDLITDPNVSVLDSVIAASVNRTPGLEIGLDEVFISADATYRTMDEMYEVALADATASLQDTINRANRTQLLVVTITPLLLLGLILIGISFYRSHHEREVAARRERMLLDGRNRFMRMVSHELRSPTTAISGFAQRLNENWTSLTEAEIEELLDVIDRQASNLTLLVDDILTLSHLETGRLRLHLGPVDVSTVIDEAVTMVAGRHDTTVAVDVATPIEAIADRDRLVQILRNLIENTAGHGESGTRIVASASETTCEIVVVDTGDVVSADAADRIFRFWDRGDGDTGHGLGLAISRHLARAMVGDLVYRPHEPTGSELVLTLPLAPTAVHHGSHPAPAARVATVS